MSPWHDVVDWVGGYPFEVARPEQVLDFCRGRGFELRKLKTCGGGHGCNEFVFGKKPRTRPLAVGWHALKERGGDKVDLAIHHALQGRATLRCRKQNSPPPRPAPPPASAGHASACRSSRTCGRPSGTRPAASPRARKKGEGGRRKGDRRAHWALKCPALGGRGMPRTPLPAGTPRRTRRPRPNARGGRRAIRRPRSGAAAATRIGPAGPGRHRRTCPARRGSFATPRRRPAGRRPIRRPVCGGPKRR